MQTNTILRYRITDCIDCNLCSYVCPSKIPLAELMARGKARLAEEGLAGAPAAPAAGESRGGTPACFNAGGTRWSSLTGGPLVDEEE